MSIFNFLKNPMRDDSCMRFFYTYGKSFRYGDLHFQEFIIEDHLDDTIHIRLKAQSVGSVAWWEYYSFDSSIQEPIKVDKKDQLIGPAKCCERRRMNIDREESVPIKPMEKNIPVTPSNPMLGAALLSGIALSGLGTVQHRYRYTPAMEKAINDN